MPRTVPTGTYRVQVRPAFDLDATAGLAGYLAELGASHLYTAPLLAAVPGSEHGYDVVDPTTVNPELGGEAARLRLVAALREHGLGLVVDIVPNHMGVARPAANPAWWDVLRRGRDSAYANWFDIDWSPPSAGRPRVVLPVLGSPDGLAELTIADGELRYHEHRFPIAEGTGHGTAQEVHDRQHYELVDWRRGNVELNYRRFFAIVELAGVRVEDPAVFDATHAEVLRWVAAGEVDGLRVDHPDGLRDPGAYLRRLRAAAPDVWLVVEKILEHEEALPASWPVEGTTGYDALREVGGLFVDPAAAEPLSHLTGDEPWPVVAHTEKLSTTRRLFGAELRRLAALAADLPDAAAALGELAASFPVYRSYLPDEREHFDAALIDVRRRRPDLADTFDALAQRITDDPTGELAARFQQLTGAVMAKGVEDTAMYRWNRLIALNEVGGAPDVFGVPVERFHDAAARRQTNWPAAMTTLSTHDTKRGEDVRARLAVLSELPGEWAEAFARWEHAAPLPDRSLTALLWQTAVGAWPIERERLRRYVVKAAREANRSTGWTDPDEAFERHLAEVVDRIYDEPALRDDVAAFAARITGPGWSNALGQKLVQLTAPGVPDTYQGTELWDNSLVDPDNRRPVDFAARRALLRELDAGLRPPVDASAAAKLLVVSRALRLRRDRPELFRRYEPVPVLGDAAGHVVAFDRGGALTVATRLPVGLERDGGWRDTELTLPPGAWTDLLTGRPAGTPRLATLLSTYPVALLVRS